MVKDKKCDSSCNEQCKIQQRILEREVDEELRREKMTALWKKYRFLVYGGIVVVLLGTVGYEWYQSWYQKIRLAESDKYEQAVVMAYTNESDKAKAQLAELSDTAKTGYGFIAKMEQAGILFSEGKNQEGLSLLRELMDDTAIPTELKNLIILSFVGHQLDTTQNPAELQTYLLPILSGDNKSHVGLAAELSAVLYMKQGTTDKALQAIETALATDTVPLQTVERLKMLKTELEQK